MELTSVVCGKCSNTFELPAVRPGRPGKRFFCEPCQVLYGRRPRSARPMLAQCVVCAGAFVPATTKSRYCSNACRCIDEGNQEGWTRGFDSLRGMACVDCGVVLPLAAGTGIETSKDRLHPECRKVREKAGHAGKNAVRRLAVRDGVSASVVARLVAEAQRCPLCDVPLDQDGSTVNGKQVDHIVPLGVGGLHVESNLRVICRTCNLSRPKDGSDLPSGQLGLAVDKAAAVASYREWCDRRDAERAAVRAAKNAERQMRRDDVLARRVLREMAREQRPARVSRYEALIPTVQQLRGAGHGYKRIARELGVNRDAARYLIRRTEAAA